MANITGKTELAETPADGDKLYIVDVSDTTDNANGSDKHVTRSNLVGGLQPTPAEGAFADGDKTKLDGIETGADVTDATNVQTALGSLDVADIGDVTITTIASGEVLKWNGTAWVNNTLAEADIQDIPAEGAFVDGDKTKLDGIETSADVTDATNVTTALGTVPVSAHSDVDTDKSKTPADGDVLTFDGTDWNAETPAGGGSGGNPYGATYVIGSTGDYANLYAWSADTPANGDILYIEEDITETSTVYFTVSDVHIIGATGVTVTFNTYNLNIQTGTGCQITNLHCAFTTGDPYFGQNNMVVDNFSATTTSTGLTMVISGDNGFFNKVRVTDNTATTSDTITINGDNNKLSNWHVNIPIASTNGNFQISGNGNQISNLYWDIYSTTSNKKGIRVSGNQNQITNSQMSTTTANGYLIEVYGDYNTVSNCVFEGAQVGIYLSSTQYTTVSNNVFKEGTNGLYCIYAGSSAWENTIVGNIVQGTWTKAIYLNGADRITVIGNVVAGASTTGLEMDSGTANNVATGNQLSLASTPLTNAGTGNLYQTATDSDPLNVV